MKKFVVAALLGILSLFPAGAGAEEQGGTLYIIKPGDTLWSLSQRFFKDPDYWPRLWARNAEITNPHLIYPGQKVRIFPDRIEIVPPPLSPEAAPAPAGEEPPVLKTFRIYGTEGFMAEDEIKAAGRIVATYEDRHMVAKDDIVYSDIGSDRGGKVGQVFSLYRKIGPMSHPVKNYTVGYRMLPLGTLRLTELTPTGSKGVITSSTRDIGTDALILPFREPKREVVLKPGSRDAEGYIVDTLNGTEAVATGDVVYLDMGSASGAEAGNVVYAVREISVSGEGLKNVQLPLQVRAAILIVDAGATTSTAVVIKTAEQIYRGDRVMLMKER